MFYAAVREQLTTKVNRLALYGLLSALIYLFLFLLPFGLLQYYTIPQPTLLSFANPGPPMLLVGFIALFWLYYAAYRLVPATLSRPMMALVFGFPLVCAVLLYFMDPFASNDISDYIMRGHMYAHLGVNPLVVPPTAFPNDPHLPFAYWVDLPTGYGPLWETLSLATAWLAGTDRLALLFAYKALVTLHFLAGIPVLYYALRAWNPALASRGTLLYAWNPLLLFEFAGNGHNDAVMIFWMLVAAALVVHRRYAFALLALEMALLTKFLPAVLVPLVLLAWWQARAGLSPLRRVAPLGAMMALMALLTWLSFLPFGIENVVRALSSASAIIKQSLLWPLFFAAQVAGLPEASAGALVRNVSVLLWLAFIGWYLLRLYRNGVTAEARRIWLLIGLYEVMFAYVLITALRVFPWYISWLFAFAPFLVGRWGYAERAILYCFSSLAIYFIEFFRWPLWFPILPLTQLLIIACAFVPPLWLSLSIWRSERQEGAPTPPQLWTAWRKGGEPRRYDLPRGPVRR